MTSLTKKTFKSSLKDLEDGLRIKDENKLTKDQFAAYLKNLQDLTKEQIDRSFEIIIKNDDINYYPTIARIRQAAGIGIDLPPKSLTMEDIERLQNS